MIKFYLPNFCLALIVLISACSSAEMDRAEVSSPNGQVQINITLFNGEPTYQVSYRGKQIISPSELGFDFDGIPNFTNLTIVSIDTSSYDQTWTQPWGEVKDIRDHHKRLLISFQEKQEPNRAFQLEWKVFDYGFGFRYIVPEQAGIAEYKIMDELTAFNFIGDYATWWIPAYGNSIDHEYLFRTSQLSSMDTTVHTPLTMVRGDSLFISIHEAALVDYAAMALTPSKGGRLKADLVPRSTGEKVRVSKSFTTPWRTVQIAESAGELITSYLGLNLNEPNKLGDVSWVKPGKYAGIWWGMHIKTQTWAAGPNHGATTENTKAMIDFAESNGLGSVLVEGWNQGWEDNWANGNLNFTNPYPDFDIEAITTYSKEKGVEIIGHHETNGAATSYEAQMDEAFAYYKKYGIDAVKTGYVAQKPSGEYHQSQPMVNHYAMVMEKMAKQQIMLDVHEPVKDTGLRRTYPNMMTREGVRGMEYNAWSSGNPPSHTVTLPFTRGLAGPIDYTPGIFDILIKNQPNYRVHNTLAAQLALYVVIYSPLQMVPDLPENYAGNPAFKFIQDVPTDWEFTSIPFASIGSYITTVRKDRNSGDWYLGSLTDDQARSFTLSLDFLESGSTYSAEIYADATDTDLETNPTAIVISDMDVNSEMTLEIKLAAGGGQAIRFKLLNDTQSITN